MRESSAEYTSRRCLDVHQWMTSQCAKHPRSKCLRSIIRARDVCGIISFSLLVTRSMKIARADEPSNRPFLFSGRYTVLSREVLSPRTTETSIMLQLVIAKPCPPATAKRLLQCNSDSAPRIKIKPGLGLNAPGHARKETADHNHDVAWGGTSHWWWVSFFRSLVCNTTNGARPKTAPKADHRNDRRRSVL